MKQEKELNNIVISLLAKGDKTTWDYFIKKDSNKAGDAMLKCLEVIKNKKE